MWIALLVAVPVVWVVAAAARKPNQFAVARQTEIFAPPEKIFPFLEDFHRWPEWSPWERMDPAMKRSYGGPPLGVGASYVWEGNRKVGSGRMEILSAEAPALLVVGLDFKVPFEAHNRAEFTLRPTPAGTQLRWAMTGKSPFAMRVFGVFLNLDQAVGKDFETGLAQLKGLAEA